MSGIKRLASTTGIKRLVSSLGLDPRGCFSVVIGIFQIPRPDVVNSAVNSAVNGADDSTHYTTPVRIKEVGNPEKKESCFPRETSDIAFVISTSNNNKIVLFVPLDSRSSLVPACGGDEGAAGMTVCCCYPRRGMDDWEL